MTDSKITSLADTLVKYSLNVKKGGSVLIQSTPEAEQLVLAVYKEILNVGGHPWQRIQFDETERVFYENASDEQIDFISPIDYAVMQKTNRILFIRTESNTGYLKHISARRIARRRHAVSPIHLLVLEKRWCASLFPSNALAQRAGITIEKYSDIFYQAVNQDWSEIEQLGKRLAKYLDNCSSITIEGQGTRLKFSIAGRKTVVGSGRFNLPDGEVFTSPLENSANGEILFEIPVDFEGHQIAGVKLNFSNGIVVKAEAEKGERTLMSLLDIDPGALKIGEFGIGINYKLNQPMGHIAFDEKIGGTCHLAIGFSLPGTGGKNESAIHFDFIKDLRQDGRIIADKRTILENGILLI